MGKRPQSKQGVKQNNSALMAWFVSVAVGGRGKQSGEKERCNVKDAGTAYLRRAYRNRRAIAIRVKKKSDEENGCDWSALDGA